MQKQELATIQIVDENSIKDMIYTIRGQKVMLDLDLARIYGYETKRFNEQVKNNIEKFEEDFMFQISKAEFECISRSKKSTSIMKVNNRGGRTYLPYAFTEQGIYMLMTVLKGELATQQSKALIRLFKSMKDYIVNNELMFNTNSYIEDRFNGQDQRMDEIEANLSQIMENFKEPSNLKEYVIYQGQRVEADIIYKEIYSLAKKSLVIVDDYISVKTLKLLKAVKPDITIAIYSDNVARNKVEIEELEDFMSDTNLDISLKPTNSKIHDRYILIDLFTDNEKIFLCGSSSKDTGNSRTSIVEVRDNEIFEDIVEYLEK